MIQIPNPQAAAVWCEKQRAQHKTIGYVPTMGALHAGHLSLVNKAVQENDLCCVSIFVNPLQFNDPDDLAKYPDTRDKDIELLEKAGCHMVYSGSLETFFPEIKDVSTLVKAPPNELSTGLEGAFRPGHLEGVKMIVERLFSTVGHCRAYFGEKDFQQTLVVRQLAKEMADNMSDNRSPSNPIVDVIVCPTIREKSGLAMSSRNVHLSDEQRKVASLIFAALSAAKDGWEKGIRTAADLERIMEETLVHRDIDIEYVAVRDPDKWTSDVPTEELGQAQALIAVYLGGVRLIDNLRLNP